MANFKRSTLGLIHEMVLCLTTSTKGFEVFGMDRVGRKVVLVRRKKLEACMADAALMAQALANFRKKTVRLDIQSERVDEFHPVND
ncbi:MAG: hypothetical protein A2075_20970 [Geobacteraceae bacterium GWC2_58_44]|nr:MAG: hypothetical protein A2075_20970 [Geobacteraceae bacterium GWC2_58_44]HBG05474.1 hypothetical protein [Geobacter sp.]